MTKLDLETAEQLLALRLRRYDELKVEIANVTSQIQSLVDDIGAVKLEQANQQNLDGGTPAKIERPEIKTPANDADIRGREKYGAARKAIIVLLREQGPRLITTEKMQAELKIPPSTLYRNLTDLQADGVISKIGNAWCFSAMISSSPSSYQAYINELTNQGFIANVDLTASPPATIPYTSPKPPKARGPNISNKFNMPPQNGAATG